MNTHHQYSDSTIDRKSLPADSWIRQLRPAIVSTILLTLLLGGAYPLTVWLIGRLPGLRDKADGSLIMQNGRVVGSKLIGQSFTGMAYFHPRPSAAGTGYDASLSSGTNWGPTNAKLIRGYDDDPLTTNSDESVLGVPQLAMAYRTINRLPENAPVPADAVTRSASGLDPHISLQNALLQLPRVAAERGLSEDAVRAAVHRNTTPRTFGLLGEAGVNVLMLNIELDSIIND